MRKQSRRAAPKKLRAIQTSRHLHVLQHRHTGHITHRRTTSYPTLAMIVLCVGVFLASWTRFVIAGPLPGPVTNSYTVHASVPGPPPSVPATIDSPNTGTKFTDTPISIGGNCPINTYEILYRNGAFSGVALCDATGHYALQTDLFPGINQLQVRDFSPTDVPGPLSNIITVFYQPPIAAPPTNSGGSSQSGNSGSGSTPQRSIPSTNNPSSGGEPLIFKTAFNYQGQYTGTASNWQLAIEGGTAPYAIAIDWGDGTRGLISRQKAGPFTLEHIYRKSGAYKGNYVVKFSATDIEGTRTFLQLLTIVNDPPAGVAITQHSANGTGDSTPFYLKQLLKYIWPSYGVVILMLASFWLGERRELRYLKPRFKKVHHA